MNILNKMYQNIVHTQVHTAPVLGTGRTPCRALRVLHRPPVETNNAVERQCTSNNEWFSTVWEALPSRGTRRARGAGTHAAAATGARQIERGHAAASGRGGSWRAVPSPTRRSTAVLPLRPFVKNDVSYLLKRFNLGISYSTPPNSWNNRTGGTIPSTVDKNTGRFHKFYVSYRGATAVALSLSVTWRTRARRPA